MSKSRNVKRKKSNTNKNLLIGGVVSIVALLGVFLLVRATGTAVPKITPAQYQQQFNSATTPHLLIDVRTPAEFASGHIAGAINIAVETLSNRLSEVPKDKSVIVYCHTGNRSAQAASILSGAGYSNIYDMGGILAWTAAGFPITQS
jgi:rhodanese-related sulfurtransferase